MSMRGSSAALMSKHRWPINTNKFIIILTLLSVAAQRMENWHSRRRISSMEICVRLSVNGSQYFRHARRAAISASQAVESAVIESRHAATVSAHEHGIGWKMAIASCHFRRRRAIKASGIERALQYEHQQYRIITRSITYEIFSGSRRSTRHRPRYCRCDCHAIGQQRPCRSRRASP